MCQQEFITLCQYDLRTDPIESSRSFRSRSGSGDKALGASLVSSATSLAQNRAQVAMATRFSCFARHILRSASASSISCTGSTVIYSMLITLLISPIGGDCTRHHQPQLPSSMPHNNSQWELANLQQNAPHNAQSPITRWSTQSPGMSTMLPHPPFQDPSSFHHMANYSGDIMLGAVFPIHDRDQNYSCGTLQVRL